MAHATKIQVFKIYAHHDASTFGKTPLSWTRAVEREACDKPRNGDCAPVPAVVVIASLTLYKPLTTGQRRSIPETVIENGVCCVDLPNCVLRVATVTAPCANLFSSTQS